MSVLSFLQLSCGVWVFTDQQLTVCHQGTWGTGRGVRTQHQHHLWPLVSFCMAAFLSFLTSSADVERDETPTQVCVCLSLTGWWSLCWWMIKYSRQTDAGNNWFSIIHIHYSTVVYIDLTCHQCTNIHLFTSAQAHLSVSVALNVQRYSTILHNSELYYTSELHSAKQQAVMYLH